jgi:hypothetical protein
MESQNYFKLVISIMNTVEILGNTDKSIDKKAEVINQVKMNVKPEIYKEIEPLLPSIIEMVIYISLNKKDIKINIDKTCKKCCF